MDVVARSTTFDEKCCSNVPVVWQNQNHLFDEYSWHTATAEPPKTWRKHTAFQTLRARVARQTQPPNRAVQQRPQKRNDPPMVQQQSKREKIQRTKRTKKKTSPHSRYVVSAFRALVKFLMTRRVAGFRDAAAGSTSSATRRGPVDGRGSPSSGDGARRRGTAPPATASDAAAASSRSWPRSEGAGERARRTIADAGDSPGAAPNAAPAVESPVDRACDRARALAVSLAGRMLCRAVPTDRLRERRPPVVCPSSALAPLLLLWLPC